MVHCHDLKEGQILWCEECGLELKVVAECDSCDPDEKTCGCGCAFTCCEKDLVVK